MPNRLRYCWLLAACFICSCLKTQEIGSDFEVSTDKTSFKVNEPVNFRIKGNPAFLTFYSGEIGKRNEFVNRTTASGTSLLQFTSLKANGTQDNTLSVLIADDFKGIGADETSTAANIAGANWTDITSRAILSTGSSTVSGPVDVTDFAQKNKPVYLAFRYAAAAGSIQPKWTITGLTITNNLTDGTIYTLATINNTAINNYGVSITTSPGWIGAKVANSYNWVISGGSTLSITGATTNELATNNSEAWVVSGPILLNRVTPDIGTAIKNMSVRMDTYSYVYRTPGTYTVVFDGRSATVYEQKDIKKSLQLTITP
jgi:hypothetical protein